jgi:hypothetical protein
MWYYSTNPQNYRKWELILDLYNCDYKRNSGTMFVVKVLALEVDKRSQIRGNKKKSKEY